MELIFNNGRLKSKAYLRLHLGCMLVAVPNIQPRQLTRERIGAPCMYCRTRWLGSLPMAYSNYCMLARVAPSIPFVVRLAARTVMPSTTHEHPYLDIFGPPHVL